MKITKRQLRQIIREVIDTDNDGTPDYRDTDSDNDGISDAEEGKPSEDPAEMYARMKALYNKYASDWSQIKSLGFFPSARLEDDAWERLLSLRDDSKDYGKFFNAVGTSFNRMTGRHEVNNEFGIRHSSYIRSLFDKKTGYPLEELRQAYEEYEKLRPRFKSTVGTSQSDRAYGRKRTKVVFIRDDGTEEVISSSTNRKGSLGT